jgi:hypothetical protein
VPAVPVPQEAVWGSLEGGSSELAVLYTRSIVCRNTLRYHPAHQAHPGSPGRWRPQAAPPATGTSPLQDARQVRPGNQADKRQGMSRAPAESMPAMLTQTHAQQEENTQTAAK